MVYKSYILAWSYKTKVLKHGALLWWKYFICLSCGMQKRRVRQKLVFWSVWGGLLWTTQMFQVTESTASLKAKMWVSLYHQ